MSAQHRLVLVVILLTACAAVAASGAGPGGVPRATFNAATPAVAIVAVPVTDRCGSASADRRVSSLAVFVDGRYGQELLLFPGSGRDRYDTLIAPLAAGPHAVELRPSSYWPPVPCLVVGRLSVDLVAAGNPRFDDLAHAPVLELRADTIGEQTDVPLYEYVEQVGGAAEPHLRYTVVFSNEDGGTATRALFARWGRATDIEQVYDVWLKNGRATREEFQGPDHEIRAFEGRRMGDAPILLVATMNNMVTDRGRGMVPVRPVPAPADLAAATRESTLDTRPWALRVMARELAAEHRVSSELPAGDAWLRVAPDAREHVYLDAALTLDRAVAAAWVRDRDGRTWWSHYGRDELAVSRNGWVRVAVAIGQSPGARVEAAGWTCLAARGDTTSGSCEIRATRAFALDDGWAPRPELVEPATLKLRVGDSGTLTMK